MCKCACSAGPKSLYTVTELAELSGLSRFQVGRLLQRNGVHLEWSGQKRFVPFAALRAALPWVVDSFGEMNAFRTL